MFTKIPVIATCLLAVVSAKPHVYGHVAPAIVTAHSSQVFARTYNGIVPIAVPAPVPAPIPVPYPIHYPTFYVPPPPPPVPAVFTYPVYTAAPAVPATPVVVATPAVVAAAPAAKAVIAAPVVKAKLVRKPAPYLTTIRYRSVYA
ncbi:calphotin-like [Topomyia yanbarensis]|uniref:calphotin-like n=1 Tax=Topomyia yanbarensis TaxID=2498891 RepID=UPI00273C5D3E|nr:calphotin-like [Topomyia yanbarensis]